MRYKISDYDIDSDVYTRLFNQLSSKNTDDILFGISILLGTLYRVHANVRMKEDFQKYEEHDTNLFIVLFCFLKKYFFHPSLPLVATSTNDCFLIENTIWKFIRTRDPLIQYHLNSLLKDQKEYSDNLQLYETVEQTFERLGCRYPTTNDLAAIQELIQDSGL